MHPGFINLDLTLQSGQVFHWQQNPDRSWSGCIGDQFVRIHENSGHLIVEVGDEFLVNRYLALDHPLEKIYASFPSDELSQQSLTHCSGLRIIRQPRWECLATFITSSMKQVAHIRSMSLAIRDQFGKPMPGFPVAAYPSFQTLAQTGVGDLLACGLGYRAQNLLKTAQILTEGKLDLEGIANLPTKELRLLLMTLPGVGVKVANCVLLFAYERLDAVPIDVWIHRILMTMRKGRKGTPEQLARYAQKRLGSYAGYVQQYLFHIARTKEKPASKLGAFSKINGENLR